MGQAANRATPDCDMDVMFDPGNFAKALERTISELRSRISDLEKETGPLEKALAVAEQELRRIARAWIRGSTSSP